MTRAYFVTGTDTGVGKTLVSTALLHALAQRYPRVVGMKPVAAGTVAHGSDWINEDVLALRAASTVQVPPELDNPVSLPDPLSPHLAAQRAGVVIDIAHIVSCYQRLSHLADAVVVEGAGGFLVPLSEEHTGADLAQALALPILLVVGLRLGCLNHTLLTLEAIRARGLVLSGWVANRIDPGMQAQDDNIAFIQRHVKAPMLADIPYQRAPDSRAIRIQRP
jgi:dethiobiotin synthetase